MVVVVAVRHRLHSPAPRDSSKPTQTGRDTEMQAQAGGICGVGGGGGKIKEKEAGVRHLVTPQAGMLVGATETWDKR